MKVIFTLQKNNKSTVDLEYQAFDNVHSALWYQGINAYCDKNIPLKDRDRVYNFESYDIQITREISRCNAVINLLNNLEKKSIPLINIKDLQNSINKIHTFFVESESNPLNSSLWGSLNYHLHGIEAIERSKNTTPQGQIFVELPDKEMYDIPEESYKDFTTKKTFGYCYANYPHIGRHLLEMYFANDDHAHDEHILPMHQISGSSYLWFGDTTSDNEVNTRNENIKKWFFEKQLDKLLNKQWGDPRLAVGWLPVAKLTSDINIDQLDGLNKLLSIRVDKQVN